MIKKQKKSNQFDRIEMVKEEKEAAGITHQQQQQRR